MRCPNHPELELRSEFNSESNTYTGFCLKCLKHHPRCTSVRYMDMCNQVAGHAGPHEAHGTEWIPFKPHAINQSEP
jgi:hypothetical protein